MARTASAPETSHAAPLCKNIYIYHFQMNPRYPSIFWRCQFSVGSWVLTQRCKEKAYLSLSGLFRRSNAAVSSAMAELGCLPETASGFVHYPTGFGWRTASFCPGCFILLNTASTRMLCEWELELSHRKVCMKERGGAFFNMVNQLGTTILETGQCHREGFWWLSLLVLLVRLKKDRYVGRREQIFSPRTGSIRGVNERVEEQVKWLLKGPQST